LLLDLTEAALTVQDETPANVQCRSFECAFCKIARRGY
jgi:hypothetical protein